MIDPRALASDELHPGERLLWVGQSDPARLFGGRDAFLVPFSLLWGGFAISWEVGVLISGAPWFFALFGSVFVLIGLHLIVGRFFVKRHRKRTEAFAVTDRRAFITNGRSSRETDVRRMDRSITWTRGRTHCSVEWGGSGGGLFSGGGVQHVYANTGMDGLFGPRPMAFFDVADGTAMVQALDDAAGR
ncbi:MULTISPECIES: hypothetical protein [unclassified Curtobacterium]|uniref:hypothetical protein n=1 Tax=unclassified Curtobacterium TaxID=257496 RepID=UPI0011B3B14C|nr:MULTISPECIES: hypothetical protein [unclassified Curtobacterium]WIB35703.1 hypothetical protein DEJ15_16430 [Curtobacterium sp. MCJR17_043]